MENRILRTASVILAVTIIAATVALEHFSDSHTGQVQQEGTSEEQISESPSIQVSESKEEEFQQQLRLELPEGMVLEDLVIENDYVRQNIIIEIPDVESNYFMEHPLLGQSNHINDLYMGKGRIEITMDAVYEVESTVEDGYLYLDFISPQEVYDKVVVIDAGHGGGAPGAISQEVMEKDINLAIVKELKALFEASDENIGVYYTRVEDENPTFEQRAQLGVKSGAELFISVHSNSTGDGTVTQEHGTEVMYDEEKKEEGLTSEYLAQVCLEETVAAMGSKNNGVLPGHSIDIIRICEIPAVLLEVGYMTNQEELEKLISPEYQKQAAQGIYNAILRVLQED